MLRLSPERAILLSLVVLSLLAVIFMGHLVAAPKLLMGRMLTAISPSLFPLIMISALGVLSALALLLTFRPGSESSQAAAEASGDSAPTDWQAVKRAVLLFACMLFYAITMVPFGFLISTFLTLVMISALAGNRSVLQIGILAIVGPVFLYLIATRVLAVSLPELNVIELFYAKLIALLGAYR